MSASLLGRLGAGATLVLAVGVGTFSWLFRFNDPGGAFAGLSDDHFFYVVRAWQLLFGELPVRDFVDHGAPLYYYVGAAVQVLFGRGTLSEFCFTVTVLAVCAATTFWLATLASGSRIAGLVGAAFQILLEPRLYNYPKILIYVVALSLLWRFADEPTARNRFWLAAVTVIGFLFRHDHGVFVAAAMGTLLLCLADIPVRRRLQHGFWYAAVSLALVAPYLLLVQVNGGVLSYFRQALAWAETDRDRASVVWPGLFDDPQGVSDLARTGGTIERAVATVADNAVAWIFYAELALPLLAVVLLASSRDGLRRDWPRARAKLTVVAVLALVLDAGFLRSPLESRLADPSVPLAVLVAWLVLAVPRAAATRAWLGPRVLPYRWVVRAVVVALGIPIAFALASTTSQRLPGRLEKTWLTRGWTAAWERVGTVADQMRVDWMLVPENEGPKRSELIELSLYVNACTAPTDRVLVQAYLPQVLALARRGFAGGHADLRPGFFGTEDAQRLTVSRLQAQSVPMILLDGDEGSAGFFRTSFPIVIAYLDRHYLVAGSRTFDGRFKTTLLVRRDRVPQGTYEPFDWPCFGPGVARL